MLRCRCRCGLAHAGAPTLVARRPHTMPTWRRLGSRVRKFLFWFSALRYSLSRRVSGSRNTRGAASDRSVAPFMLGRNSRDSSARTGRTRALAMDGRRFRKAPPPTSCAVTKRTSRGREAIYGVTMETDPAHESRTANDRIVARGPGAAAGAPSSAGRMVRGWTVRATVSRGCSATAFGGLREVNAALDAFILHTGDDTCAGRKENPRREQTNFRSDALWRRVRVAGPGTRTIWAR